MTTIRVLILTNDKEYCHRLTPYFAKFHPEVKLSYSISESGAYQGLTDDICNVLLIGDEFSNANINIPNGVAAAYICADPSGGDINGMRSYSKYKSGETLYRMIVSLFAEISNIQQIDRRDNKVFAFIGANGGAGTATVAAAFAYRQAARGKRTLFFCCDQFSDHSRVLSDNTDGGTLSDLIFIVKSAPSSGSASLKAAALLKKDVSGVRFLENSPDPTAFDNLTPEQIDKMLDIISSAEEFDCVVVDVNVSDERCRRLITKKADMIFIVAESSESAKLYRLINYLKITDRRAKTNMTARLMIVFNKNDTNAQFNASYEGVKICGSIPRYKDKNARNIANAMAKLDIWNAAAVD